MRQRWFRTPDARLKKLLARLRSDEGGNIIVLYVAAALLLIGMLWAIIGTGARMVQKETIQSSADAAAFSAAVIKAKGLNIIAFCNLVMALLLAVIMLLRLIKIGLTILAGVCLLSCFNIYGGEVLCAFAPSATALLNQYTTVVNQVEPRILDAMKGLSKLERAVGKTFPALATVEAYRVGTHDHYKKNFGKGTLLTIAWPLPVGKDLSLPTKDGTWNTLCDQATDTFDRVIEIAMSKMGLPSVIGSIFGNAVKGLLWPLKGVLCPGSTGATGGSSTIDVDTTAVYTSCGECIGADASKWQGDRVAADGTVLAAGEICNQTGFNAFNCPSSGSATCNGQLYKNLSFVSCVKKTKTPADLGQATSDKPLPLELADDWKQRTNVRAFTLLTDANVAERRQSVAVGTRQKGSSPALNQLLGTAQAEFFQFNGATDLWHMDWRARLVRFTFGDTSTTDTGDAGSQGVPGGAAGAIAGKIEELISKDGAAAFADQFMLH